MILNFPSGSQSALLFSGRNIPALYKYPAILLAVLMLVGFSREALPQEAPTSSPNNHAEQVLPGMVPTASVLLDGEEMFHVRGISAYPAEVRAKKISERIEIFAADLSRPIQSLRLTEENESTHILADKQLLTAVFEIDSQLEGGVGRQLMARAYLLRIVEAVTTYREQRKVGNLLTHSVYALVATGILWFGWWGLRWIFDKFDLAIGGRYKARVKDLKIQKVMFLQAEQIWAGLRGTLKSINLVLLLFLLYAYLNFVFRLFPWTSHLGKKLFSVILDPLRVMGQGLVGAIPSLIFLFILVTVFRFLLKFGKLIFTNLAAGKVSFKGFDQEWAWPTYRIFRALVIAFGAVMAYPHIPGSESNAFKGISLFMGVLLSLGATSVISNILAGYSLVYRRAFRVGDRIQVNEHVGDVVERRLLVTHLRSLKNEEIIVPNSVILNHPVINYSSLAKQQGLILHLTVGIGYETPWRQVEAMLLGAVDRTPGLLKKPPPFVLQQGLGDFCVTYELNAYCDQPKEMMELYNSLSQNILDVFNEYGVQIMTPAYRDDPEKPKIVPKEQWFTPPAQPSQKN
ncbi:MAG: mechanosensitive ion channel family protein [Nitrospirota bacterium]|nr:mechanosensitive ion channel family protein [Nitrospirota bacterium]MDH5586376.1 mechanosensitive ion channel family protein [Nitrospirota bacterium]MDH5775489.1 mechanosensitive ion channel family protein [Nitrospirota bacterium]